MRLCSALWRLWDTHGHLTEGRRRLSEVLRVTETAMPSRQAKVTRAAVLRGAAVLAHAQGDHSAAQTVEEERLALCRELDDQRGIAGSLNNLGMLAETQGDYGLANSQYLESLALARNLGDPSSIGRPLNNLGHVAMMLGELMQARSLYKESLAIFEQLGDRRRIAYLLKRLGDLEQLEANFEEARSQYEKSTALGVELEDRRLIALSLEGLAGLEAARGQPGRALRLAGAAAGILMSIGVEPSVFNQQRLKGWLQPATRALSAKASEYSWAEGRAMSIEQVVAYALQPLPEAEFSSADGR
jgi:tetratricopeptide (TPR) repeat protein